MRMRTPANASGKKPQQRRNGRRPCTSMGAPALWRPPGKTSKRRRDCSAATLEAHHALYDRLAGLCDFLLLARHICAVLAQFLRLAVDLHAHHFVDLVAAAFANWHGFPPRLSGAGPASGPIMTLGPGVEQAASASLALPGALEAHASAFSSSSHTSSGSSSPTLTRSRPSPMPRRARSSTDSARWELVAEWLNEVSVPPRLGMRRMS